MIKVQENFHYITLLLFFILISIDNVRTQLISNSGSFGFQQPLVGGLGGFPENQQLSQEQSDQSIMTVSPSFGGRGFGRGLDTGGFRRRPSFLRTTNQNFNQQQRQQQQFPITGILSSDLPAIHSPFDGSPPQTSFDSLTDAQLIRLAQLQQQQLTFPPVVPQQINFRERASFHRQTFRITEHGGGLQANPWNQFQPDPSVFVPIDTQNN